MNAVLIPVRSMTGAKNRLATALDDVARTQLTLAMLGDMIKAAHGARLVHTVYVVSADAALLERAKRLGAEALEESAQVAAAVAVTPSRTETILAGTAVAVPPASTEVALSGADRVRGGLNRAVWGAATKLEHLGIRCLLTIPGDVPLITPAEIDDLFSAAASAPVVLAPSTAGSGTNGLVTAPPTVIAPQFEGESLRAHVRACEAAGVVYTIRRPSGFGLDIDTAEDLRTLAMSDGDGESVSIATALLALPSPSPLSARVAGGLRR